MTDTADHTPEHPDPTEPLVKLGSLLADIGRQASLSDEEFAVFEQAREQTPAGPVRPE